MKRKPHNTQNGFQHHSISSKLLTTQMGGPKTTDSLIGDIALA